MTPSGKLHIYVSFLIAILFAFTGKLSAQGNSPVYFEVALPGNQIAYDLTTLPYDNVALVGQHQDAVDAQMQGWMHILKKDGSTVSTYTYQEPGYSIAFKRIEMFGLQQAVIAAERTLLTTLKKQTGILKFSLNQQHQPVFLSAQWLGDSTSNCSLKGMYLKSTPQAKAWLYGEDQANLDAFILTETGMRIFDGPGRQVLHGLRPLSDSTWIALAGGISSASGVSVLYLDTQLNILSSTDLPEEVYEPSGFDILEDTTWICTANINYCLPSNSGFRPRDIAIITGSRNTLPRLMQCIGVPEVNDKPADVSANRLQDGVLISYTSGQRVFVPQGQGYGRNRVPLVRIDTAGNIVQASFVTPEAYYEIHRVKRPVFETDGTKQWVTGSVYDVYNPSMGTNAFVLSVHEEVVLTSEKSNTEDHLKLYPSPAASASLLFAEANDKTIEAINITDMSGKRYACYPEGTAWRLPEITAGIYVLEIEFSDYPIHYHKIIIQ
jgi:hypothetical protein